MKPVFLPPPPPPPTTPSGIPSTAHRTSPHPMKDNFSTQASEYARFRPTYPDEVFAFILGLIPEKDSAWDCGTGNGQVAVRLADHFNQVIATDISRKQMDEAPQRENIAYQLVAAEEAVFPANHFDLITVAQAVHWFDLEQFYAVVNRVLKPNGVIALLGYTLLTIDEKLDPVIYNLYEDILGKYWDPERRIVEDRYQTIPFPFQEIPTPEFHFTVEWTFDQLIGYFNTWSAAQHYRKDKGNNPVDLVAEDLRSAWGTSEKKHVQFPLIIRLGRK
uniref:Class I SAM-dependent methyltransferase n=1 Tax=Roseihalotalea indica TaxID=2867963 RepID=A0AA49GK13_9BACT|nr:class I SAM-dependent methyltransferase [Tunicatimonas sp. TK19036]